MDKVYQEKQQIKLEISLNRKSKDLLATCEFLKDELERAILLIKSREYQNLNALGIVQYSGQKIDVLTAEVVLIDQFLKENGEQK